MTRDPTRCPSRLRRAGMSMIMMLSLLGMATVASANILDENNNMAAGGLSVIGGGGNNTAVGDYSVVTGGFDNEALGLCSSINGGFLGVAGDRYSVVGGGYQNKNYGAFSTVSGGFTNSAYSQYAALGGGVENYISGFAGTVAGGFDNTIFNSYSTIGGGYFNFANLMFATIGGGNSNMLYGYAAVVAGGDANTGYGAWSAIGGGSGHKTGYKFAVIGGGKDNYNYGYAGVVGGGLENSVVNDYSTIGGGYANYAGYKCSTVSGGNSNYAVGYAAFVGGGYMNSAQGLYSTVSGGRENYASAYATVVNGGSNNSVNGMYSTVAGGRENYVAFTYATVSGGGYNSVMNSYSTIGGGFSNYAVEYYVTVAGGYNNYATGYAGVIAGGYYNTATALYGVVGGGYYNTNRGEYSTVAAGKLNKCLGNYCTVSGGGYNVAETYSVSIAGGYRNSATLDAPRASIGGGAYNTVEDESAVVGGGAYNVGAWKYSVVAGGAFNYVAGYGATITGGLYNQIYAAHASVGGGYRNSADGYLSTIGGGEYNVNVGYAGFIGGGHYHTSRGYTSFIGGGSHNVNNGYAGTIGGGYYNLCNATECTVAGGELNWASGYWSTISGGTWNAAGAVASTVGGGYWNTCDGIYGLVSGGRNNHASGLASAVNGGARNTAEGTWSAVSGGFFNYGGGHGAIVSGGTHNVVNGSFAAVAGGQHNEAAGNWSFVGGGWDNSARGTGSMAQGSGATALHDFAAVMGFSTTNRSCQSVNDSTISLCADNGVFVNGELVPSAEDIVELRQQDLLLSQQLNISTALTLSLEEDSQLLRSNTSALWEETVALHARVDAIASAASGGGVNSAWSNITITTNSSVEAHGVDELRDAIANHSLHLLLLERNASLQHAQLGDLSTFVSSNTLTVASLLSDYANLSVEVNALTVNVDDADGAIQSVNGSLQSAIHSIEGLREEDHQLQSNLSALAGNVADTIARVDALDVGADAASVQQLHREVLLLTTNVSSLASDTLGLHATIAHVNQSLHEMEGLDAAVLFANITALARELDDSDAELAALQLADNQHSLLLETVASNTTAHNLWIDSATIALSNLGANQQTLLSNFSDQQQVLRHHASRLAALNSSTLHVEDILAEQAARSLHHSVEISQLEHNVTDQAAAMREVAAKVRQVVWNASDHAVSIAALRTYVDEVASEQERVVEQLNSRMNASVESHRVEVQNLNRTLIAQAMYIDDVASSTDVNTEDIAIVLGNLDTMNATIVDTMSTISLMKGTSVLLTNETLQRELDSLSAQLSGTNLNNVTRTIDVLVEKLETLQDRDDQLAVNISAVVLELSTERGRIDALDADSNTAKVQILHGQVAFLESNVTALAQHTDALGDAVARVNHSLAELESLDVAVLQGNVTDIFAAQQFLASNLHRMQQQQGVQTALLRSLSDNVTSQGVEIELVSMNVSQLLGADGDLWLNASLQQHALDSQLQQVIAVNASVAQLGHTADLLEQRLSAQSRGVLQLGRNTSASVALLSRDLSGLRSNTSDTVGELWTNLTSQQTQITSLETAMTSVSDAQESALQGLLAHAEVVDGELQSLSESIESVNRTNTLQSKELRNLRNITDGQLEDIANLRAVASTINSTTVNTRGLVDEHSVAIALLSDNSTLVRELRQLHTSIGRSHEQVAHINRTIITSVADIAALQQDSSVFTSNITKLFTWAASAHSRIDELDVDVNSEKVRLLSQQVAFLEDNVTAMDEHTIMLSSTIDRVNKSLADLETLDVAVLRSDVVNLGDVQHTILEKLATADDVSRNHSDELSYLAQNATAMQNDIVRLWNDSAALQAGTHALWFNASGQQSLLEDHSSRIDEFDAHLANLSSAQYSSITQQAHEVSTLESRLNVTQFALSVVNSSVLVQSDELASLLPTVHTLNLTVRDQSIVARRQGNTIRELNQTITTQGEALASQSAELERLRLASDTLNGTVFAERQRSAAKDLIIDALESTVNHQQLEINALNTSLNALASAVEQMMKSTTFAPVTDVSSDAAHCASGGPCMTSNADSTSPDSTITVTSSTFDDEATSLSPKTITVSSSTFDDEATELPLPVATVTACNVYPCNGNVSLFAWDQPVAVIADVDASAASFAFQLLSDRDVVVWEETSTTRFGSFVPSEIGDVSHGNFRLSVFIELRDGRVVHAASLPLQFAAPPTLFGATVTWVNSSESVSWFDVVVNASGTSNLTYEFWIVGNATSWMYLAGVSADRTVALPIPRTRSLSLEVVATNAYGSSAVCKDCGVFTDPLTVNASASEVVRDTISFMERTPQHVALLLSALDVAHKVSERSPLVDKFLELLASNATEVSQDVVVLNAFVQVGIVSEVADAMDIVGAKISAGATASSVQLYFDTVDMYGAALLSQDNDMDAVAEMDDYLTSICAATGTGDVPDGTVSVFAEDSYSLSCALSEDIVAVQAGAASVVASVDGVSTVTVSSWNGTMNTTSNTSLLAGIHGIHVDGGRPEGDAEDVETGLTLKIDLATGVDAVRKAIACMYYDEDTATWSTRGVVLRGIDVDVEAGVSAVCSSSHLTLFTVGDASEAAQVVESKLLTFADRVDDMNNVNFREEGGGINWNIMGVFVGITGVAAITIALAKIKGRKVAVERGRRTFEHDGQLSKPNVMGSKEFEAVLRRWLSGTQTAKLIMLELLTSNAVAGLLFHWDHEAIVFGGADKAVILFGAILMTFVSSAFLFDPNEDASDDVLVALWSSLVAAALTNVLLLPVQHFLPYMVSNVNSLTTMTRMPTSLLKRELKRLSCWKPAARKRSNEEVQNHVVRHWMEYAMDHPEFAKNVLRGTDVASVSTQLHFVGCGITIPSPLSVGTCKCDVSNVKETEQRAIVRMQRLLRFNLGRRREARRAEFRAWYTSMRRERHILGMLSTAVLLILAVFTLLVCLLLSGTFNEEESLMWLSDVAQSFVVQVFITEPATTLLIIFAKLAGSRVLLNTGKRRLKKTLQKRQEMVDKQMELAHAHAKLAAAKLRALHAIANHDESAVKQEKAVQLKAKARCEVELTDIAAMKARILHKQNLKKGLRQKSSTAIDQESAELDEREQRTRHSLRSAEAVLEVLHNGGQDVRQQLTKAQRRLSKLQKSLTKIAKAKAVISRTRDKIEDKQPSAPKKSAIMPIVSDGGGEEQPDVERASMPVVRSASNVTKSAVHQPALAKRKVPTVRRGARRNRRRSKNETTNSLARKPTAAWNAKGSVRRGTSRVATSNSTLSRNQTAAWTNRRSSGGESASGARKSSRPFTPARSRRASDIKRQQTAVWGGGAAAPNSRASPTEKPFNPTTTETAINATTTKPFSPTPTQKPFNPGGPSDNGFSVDRTPTAALSFKPTATKKPFNPPMTQKPFNPGNPSDNGFSVDRTQTAALGFNPSQSATPPGGLKRGGTSVSTHFRKGMTWQEIQELQASLRAKAAQTSTPPVQHEVRRHRSENMSAKLAKLMRQRRERRRKMLAEAQKNNGVIAEGAEYSV